MEIPGEKFSWMRFKLEFRVHTFSSFPSVLWVLLTCSWEMLKLDLTGHSSHVSFSRNILSSSRRALRGCKKMIETARVIKLKGSEGIIKQLKTSMKRSARQQKAGFVRHSSVIFYRYRHPRFALSVLNRAEVLTKECSTSPTLKKVWRMSDEGRKKWVNLCTLKDFHCFLAWLCVCFHPRHPTAPPTGWVWESTAVAPVFYLSYLNTNISPSSCNNSDASPPSLILLGGLADNVRRTSAGRKLIRPERGAWR